MIADSVRVTLLLALGAISLLLAYQLPGDLFLDFGPNDGRYVRGFREDFEVDESTIIHWSGDRASVSLPFALEGPFDVTLRYKRHIVSPANVRFFFEDEPAGAVTVPQQDFGLHELHAENTAGGTFQLRISSSSRDRRPLGLALDWMQVRPAPRFGAVLPSASALLYVLSWVLAFYLVPRVVGLGPRVALTSGIAAAACLVALASVHKLWPVHAAMTLGARAHVIMVLVLAFYLWRRRRAGSAFSSPEARWAVYLVFVGLAIRLFALFHPDFYYPDVRTHSKFVSLIWTEGIDGFFSDYIENQHTHLLGLQLVGSDWLAFPYPPLLYLSIYPLSLLQLPVEDWMKIVPTALVAVEALVLFALAGKLGIGARAALVAVALHASARVLAFRLAVASYAALFGHFWDVLAVAYLVFFFDRIERPRYALGFAALITVSLLSYAGSALVLGLFVPAFSVALVVGKANRSAGKRAGSIAAWALLGAIAAVAGFYWQYVPEVLIRPETTASGSELVDAALTPLSALSMTVYRLNLFYGVFGFAALVSLYFFRGTLSHRLAAPLTTACMVTFVGLNFLRAGLGSTHIFQFSKDDLVILPVVVLALGMVVERLWRGGRGRSALAAAIVLSWMIWGLVALASDIRGRFLRPDYPPPTAEAGG